MNPLVRVRNVHKYFTRGSERIDVLQGVNLEIPEGDFLALMGPSGSGKTTLLNLVGWSRQDRRKDRSRSATSTSPASPAGSYRAGAPRTSASCFSSTTCCPC